MMWPSMSSLMFLMLTGPYLMPFLASWSSCFIILPMTLQPLFSFSLSHIPLPSLLFCWQLFVRNDKKCTLSANNERFLCIFWPCNSGPYICEFIFVTHIHCQLSLLNFISQTKWCIMFANEDDTQHFKNWHLSNDKLVVLLSLFSEN